VVLLPMGQFMGLLNDWAYKVRLRFLDLW
jgi:hypothetical protein